MPQDPSHEQTGIAPCPFCKDAHQTVTKLLGDLESGDESGKDTLFFVQCDNILCGASGPVGRYDDAIDKWNHRPDPLERIANVLDMVLDHDKNALRMFDVERGNVYKTHLGKKLSEQGSEVRASQGQADSLKPKAES